MKKLLIMFLTAVAIVAMTTGCASLQRLGKDIGSDISGGINRTVTVYSMSGEKLETYTGIIDIEDNGDYIIFDLNGKRTIIYGGTVVIQEN